MLNVRLLLIIITNSFSCLLLILSLVIQKVTKPSIDFNIIWSHLALTFHHGLQVPHFLESERVYQLNGTYMEQAKSILYIQHYTDFTMMISEVGVVMVYITFSLALVQLMSNSLPAIKQFHKFYQRNPTFLCQVTISISVLLLISSVTILAFFSSNPHRVKLWRLRLMAGLEFFFGMLLLILFLNLLYALRAYYGLIKAGNRFRYFDPISLGMYRLLLVCFIIISFLLMDSTTILFTNTVVDHNYSGEIPIPSSSRLTTMNIMFGLSGSIYSILYIGQYMPCFRSRQSVNTNRDISCMTKNTIPASITMG
ncbi:hypothetical protein BC833DRAFT_577055 [Globomyces pollinis-pini]|nr:hypothetical protein BC833DRAFT_577055 [Globomyces pollinis-pini]